MRCKDKVVVEIAPISSALAYRTHSSSEQLVGKTSRSCRPPARRRACNARWPRLRPGRCRQQGALWRRGDWRMGCSSSPPAQVLRCMRWPLRPYDPAQGHSVATSRLGVTIFADHWSDVLRVRLCASESYCGAPSERAVHLAAAFLSYACLECRALLQTCSWPAEAAHCWGFDAAAICVDPVEPCPWRLRRSHRIFGRRYACRWLSWKSGLWVYVREHL